MKKLLVVAALFLSQFSFAQVGRVSIAGGVLTNSIPKEEKGSSAVYSPVWDLSVSRQNEKWEFGMDFKSISLASSFNGLKYYYAGTGIPVTLFFNRKFKGFYAGGNLGIIMTFVKTGKAYFINEYNGTVGVTLGTQAGYRLKISKNIDCELQLQGNYINLFYDNYHKGLFYLDGLFGIGYNWY